MNKFNSLIKDVIDANNKRYERINEICEKIKDIESALNKEKVYIEFSYLIDHVLTLKWTKISDDPIKFRLNLFSTEEEERSLLEHPLNIREQITEDILFTFLVELKNHINK